MLPPFLPSPFSPCPPGKGPRPHSPPRAVINSPFFASAVFRFVAYACALSSLPTNPAAFRHRTLHPVTLNPVAVTHWYLPLAMPAPSTATVVADMPQCTTMPLVIKQALCSMESLTSKVMKQSAKAARSAVSNSCKGTAPKVCATHTPTRRETGHAGRKEEDCFTWWDAERRMAITMPIAAFSRHLQPLAPAQYWDMQAARSAAKRRRATPLPAGVERLHRTRGTARYSMCSEEDELLGLHAAWAIMTGDGPACPPSCDTESRQLLLPSGAPLPPLTLNDAHIHAAIQRSPHASTLLRSCNSQALVSTAPHGPWVSGAGWLLWPWVDVSADGPALFQVGPFPKRSVLVLVKCPRGRRGRDVWHPCGGTIATVAQFPWLRTWLRRVQRRMGGKEMRNAHYAGRPGKVGLLPPRPPHGCYWVRMAWNEASHAWFAFRRQRLPLLADAVARHQWTEAQCAAACAAAGGGARAWNTVVTCIVEQGLQPHGLHWMQLLRCAPHMFRYPIRQRRMLAAVQAEEDAHAAMRLHDYRSDLQAVLLFLEVAAPTVAAALRKSRQWCGGHPTWASPWPEHHRIVVCRAGAQAPDAWAGEWEVRMNRGPTGPQLAVQLATATQPLLHVQWHVMPQGGEPQAGVAPNIRPLAFTATMPVVPIRHVRVDDSDAVHIPQAVLVFSRTRDASGRTSLHVAGTLQVPSLWVGAAPIVLAAARGSALAMRS